MTITNEMGLWPASWRMVQQPRILELPKDPQHMVHNHQPDHTMKQAEMLNAAVFFCIRARNLPQCTLSHYEVRIYNGLPTSYFSGMTDAPIWTPDQLGKLMKYIAHKQTKRQTPKLVIVGGVPHESHISSYLHLFLAPVEAQVWDLPDFSVPLHSRSGAIHIPPAHTV